MRMSATLEVGIEDFCSRSAHVKSFQGSIFTDKLDVEMHICHTSYMGGVNRTIIVQACPSKNLRPYLKNN
jgi:hypothetical protein